MSSLQTQLFTIVPDPNGNLESRYPNGVIPSSTLAWGTIPNTATLGSTTSINVRNYLSGSGAAGATLSLIALSESPNPWPAISFSDPNLTFTYGSSSAGSGLFQIKAVNGSVTALSNQFTVSGAQSPLNSNTFSPTPPLGPTGVIGGTSTAPTVTVSCFPSMAVTPAGYTADSMGTYQLYLNGVAQGSAQTLSSSYSFNLSASPLGTFAPAISSFTQTGSNYSFTCGGDPTDFYSTSDNGAFAGAQLTGDYILSAYVGLINGATGVSSSAPSIAGIMIRTSTDPQSPYFAIFKTADANNAGVAPIIATQYRSTYGGAVSSGSSVSNTGGVQLIIQKTGTVLTAYYWNGSALTTLGAPVSIAFGASTIAGVAANSGVNGASIAPTFGNLAITPNSTITFPAVSVSAGSTPTFTIRSTSTDGNVSPTSSQLTLSIPSSGGSTVWSGAPLLASIFIGDDQNYQSQPACLTYMSCCHYNEINGAYEGFAASFNTTRASIVNAIQNNSLIGSIVAQYGITDVYQTSSGSPSWPAWIDSNNWYLYQAGNSGSKVNLGTSTSPQYYTNMTVNPNVPVDSNGNRLQAAFAAYMVGRYLTGSTADAAPSLKAFRQDNVTYEPRASGDFTITGSSQSNTSTAAQQQIQAGFASWVSYLRAHQPNLKLWANLAAAPGQPIYGLYQIFDGVLAEGLTGETYSIETWNNNGGGYTANAIAALQFSQQQGTVNGSGYVVAMFNNMAANGTDPYGTTPYQASRYCLALAQVVPNVLAAFSVDDSYSYKKRVWFDEMSVNVTTGAAIPLSTVAATSPGIGWLGNRTVAMQFLQGSNGGGNSIYGTIGVYVMQFQNGVVLLSPRGNGVTGTFTIPGGPYHRITGTQAPSINSGARNVTTAQLQDRDGLFLLRGA